MSARYQSPELPSWRNWGDPIEIAAEQQAMPKSKVTHKSARDRKTNRVYLTLDCGHMKRDLAPTTRVGRKTGCPGCYQAGMIKAEQMICTAGLVDKP